MADRAKLAEAGRRKLEEFRKVKALSRQAPPAKTSETSGNALASGNLPVSNAGVLASPTEVPGQLALNATPSAQRAVEPASAEAPTPTAAAGVEFQLLDGAIPFLPTPKDKTGAPLWPSPRPTPPSSFPAATQPPSHPQLPAALPNQPHELPRLSMAPPGPSPAFPPQPTAPPQTAQAQAQALPPMLPRLGITLTPQPPPGAPSGLPGTVETGGAPAEEAHGPANTSQATLLLPSPARSDPAAPTQPLPWPSHILVRESTPDEVSGKSSRGSSLQRLGAVQQEAQSSHAQAPTWQQQAQEQAPQQAQQQAPQHAPQQAQQQAPQLEQQRPGRGEQGLQAGGDRDLPGVHGTPTSAAVLAAVTSSGGGAGIAGPGSGTGASQQRAGTSESPGASVPAAAAPPAVPPQQEQQQARHGAVREPATAAASAQPPGDPPGPQPSLADAFAQFVQEEDDSVEAGYTPTAQPPLGHPLAGSSPAAPASSASGSVRGSRFAWLFGTPAVSSSAPQAGPPPAASAGSASSKATPPAPTESTALTATTLAAQADTDELNVRVAALKQLGGVAWREGAPTPTVSSVTSSESMTQAQGHTMGAGVFLTTGGEAISQPSVHSSQGGGLTPAAQLAGSIPPWPGQQSSSQQSATGPSPSLATGAGGLPWSRPQPGLGASSQPAALPAASTSAGKAGSQAGPPPQASTAVRAAAAAAAAGPPALMTAAAAGLPPPKPAWFRQQRLTMQEQQQQQSVGTVSSFPATSIQAPPSALTPDSTLHPGPEPLAGPLLAGPLAGFKDSSLEPPTLPTPLPLPLLPPKQQPAAQAQPAGPQLQPVTLTPDSSSITTWAAGAGEGGSSSSSSSRPLSAPTTAGGAGGQARGSGAPQDAPSASPSFLQAYLSSVLAPPGPAAQPAPGVPLTVVKSASSGSLLGISHPPSHEGLEGEGWGDSSLGQGEAGGGDAAAWSSELGAMQHHHHGHQDQQQQPRQYEEAGKKLPPWMAATGEQQAGGKGAAWELVERHHHSHHPSSSSLAAGREANASAVASLQLHIDELTREKLELSRGLETQYKMQLALSEENEALADRLNAQGKTLDGLQQQVAKYESELQAQALALEALGAERDAARVAMHEAVDRATGLAGEVVVLEASLLQARSQQLKHEKEAAERSAQASQAERALAASRKDAAALNADLGRLMQEKRALFVRLKQTESRLNKMMEEAGMSSRARDALLAGLAPVPCITTDTSCQCDLLQPQHLQDLAQQLAQAQLAVEEAQASCSSWQAEAAAARSAAAQTQAQLAELQREQQQLQQQLQQAAATERQGQNPGGGTTGSLAGGVSANGSHAVGGEAPAVQPRHPGSGLASSRDSQAALQGDAPSAVIADRAMTWLRTTPHQAAPHLTPKQQQQRQQQPAGNGSSSSNGGGRDSGSWPLPAGQQEAKALGAPGLRGPGLEGTRLALAALQQWLPAGPVSSGSRLAAMAEEEVRLVQAIHASLTHLEGELVTALQQLGQAKAANVELARTNAQLTSRLEQATQRLELSLAQATPSLAITAPAPGPARSPAPSPAPSLAPGPGETKVLHPLPPLPLSPDHPLWSDWQPGRGEPAQQLYSAGAGGWGTQGADREGSSRGGPHRRGSDPDTPEHTGEQPGREAGQQQGVAGHGAVQRHLLGQGGFPASTAKATAQGGGEGVYALHQQGQVQQGRETGGQQQGQHESQHQQWRQDNQGGALGATQARWPHEGHGNAHGTWHHVHAAQGSMQLPNSSDHLDSDVPGHAQGGSGRRAGWLGFLFSRGARPQKRMRNNLT